MTTSRARIVIVVVLAMAAAAIGALVLRPAADEGPTVLEVSTLRHEARVSVDAVLGGTSPVEVELTDPAGVTAVRIEPTMPQMGHGREPVVAEPVAGDEGGGSYRAAVLFDEAGFWELHVVIDDAQGSERFLVPVQING